ncbi:MAG: Rap1a/Tai family immunity protein [Spirochaetia bacterium]
MKKLLVLVVVLILVGAASWAQSTSKWRDWWIAQTLHDQWTSYQKFDNHDPNANMLDIGSFMGVVVGVVMMEESADLHLFSIPSNALPAQIFAVVGKYVSAHPEEWNLPAAQLVVEALRAVWPYRK